MGRRAPPEAVGVVKLIVAGLGNPGSTYAGHRHNVGSWCINRFARRHQIALKAGRIASLGRGRIGDAEVVLVKPRTFVNRSGQALAPALKREKAGPADLLVIYDDLDLPVGRLRLRQRGGGGGHNGLKSIIDSLGSGDFSRVRIGIGRPLANGLPSWDPEVIANYVLSPPAAAERELLEAAVEKACGAIEYLLANGFERAMDQFNR